MSASLVAPSDVKHRAMRAQRERHTQPEIAIRRELHRRGLRYRLHRRIIPGTRREVDIVFPGPRVAVDVRGCFWHSCPQHATAPANNAAWWRDKLEANRRRDVDTERRLRQAGWQIIVVWEHESPARAAARIEKIVRSRL